MEFMCSQLKPKTSVVFGNAICVAVLYVAYPEIECWSEENWMCVHSQMDYH